MVTGAREHGMPCSFGPFDEARFLFKWLPLSRLQAFHWTGRNLYFALCEQSFLSFGGG